MRPGTGKTPPKTIRVNRREFLASSVVALTGLNLRGAEVTPGETQTAAATPGAPQAIATEEFNVSIRVDAARVEGEMRPVWRFFGCDEPNYIYMKDGQKLLSQLAALSPAPVYVRAHNLLTSGDGTPALKWGSSGAYAEDAIGRPRYDWTIVDRIFDTLRERGLKPLVEIGFMPEALSSQPEPYRHHWSPGEDYRKIFTGWAYPPKDYAKWRDLVYQWTRHCVEKYGRREVESWYWEVWNEPNIGYWQGKPDEYHKLYDYAVDGVKRALPTARVGGPHSTGPRGGSAAKFLRDFLEHCVRGANLATGKTGAPLDFIAFHAKGGPRFVDGHVQTGIAGQLQDVNGGFEIVASHPELRDKPIIIGESDPDGCAACPARVYPQNGYRNGALYASYTAAAFARKYQLADRHGVNFEGAVTWAFEFEDQPWFDGFRVLATNGVELPVLNVFRMFGLMRGRRVSAASTGEVGLDTIRQKGVREQPDVSALAALRERELCVLVWHHHDDDLPGPLAAIELSIAGLPIDDGRALLHHYRIDEQHSNSFTTWKKMGSPQRPTPEQYAELERSGRLALVASPEWLRVQGGKITVRLKLPRQAVSLLRLNG